MLYLTAAAGCGKSVLLKSLVDNELAAGSQRMVCYFFFKQNAGAQDSVLEALNAVLHQMFRQAPYLIQEAMGSFHDNGKNLKYKISELWAIFQTCVEKFKGEVFCVFDSFDESQTRPKDTVTSGARSHPSESASESDMVFRKQLVTKLDEWQKTVNNSGSSASARAGGVLKLLVSARPEADQLRKYEVPEGCRQSLAADPILSEVDVELVLDARFKNLEIAETIKPTLKAKIMEVQSKSRTFLWLRLVLDLLEARADLHGQDLKEYEKFLTEFPATLDESYESILARSTNPKKCRMILHLVLAAQRPLTVMELNIALKFTDRGYIAPKEIVEFQEEANFEKTLRACTGNFVTIQFDKTISLLHLTARDFLLGKETSSSSDSGPWRHSFASGLSEYLMSKACIFYINHFVDENAKFIDAPPNVERAFLNARDVNKLSAVFKEIRHFIRSHVFMDYASVNWVGHLDKGTYDTDCDFIDRVKPLLAFGSPTFKVWLLCCWFTTLGPELDFSTMGALIHQVAISHVRKTVVRSKSKWYATRLIRGWCPSVPQDRSRETAASFLWSTVEASWTEGWGLEGYKNLLRVIGCDQGILGLPGLIMEKEMRGE